MYAESRRNEMPSGTSGVGSSIQIVIVTDRGFGRKRRPSAFEQICVAGIRVAVRKLVITQFYQITIQRLTVTALIKICPVPVRSLPRSSCTSVGVAPGEPKGYPSYTFFQLCHQTVVVS